MTDTDADALVVPVRTTAGRPAVLKLGLPAEATAHEHLALQHWGGRGAVRLLRADPRRRALLLERLHPVSLAELQDVEACEVVAALYGQLHVPAPPQLRPLTEHVEQWADRLVERLRTVPLPRRLVEQAVSLSRDLVADSDSTGTLVHGDLHYAHVRAGGRAPWLAVAPRPLNGDPHVEPAPMLWQRFEELGAGGLSVRDGIRRRFHALVDGAGLDEDRTRDWVVVRAVQHAVSGPGPGVDRDVHLTRCIAVAKAVQD